MGDDKYREIESIKGRRKRRQKIRIPVGSEGNNRNIQCRVMNSKFGVKRPYVLLSL